MDRKLRVADRRLVRAYESGCSLRELSQRTGWARLTVKDALFRAGVALRSPKQMPTDARWWRAQVRAGREPAEIAAEFGVTVQAVYFRLRRAGLARSAPVSFEKWLKDRTQPDGSCLRWTGNHTVDGYPLTYAAGRAVGAHRVVWRRSRCPIPPGYEVVHVAACPHRDCVRPTHLRLVEAHERVAQDAAAGRLGVHGEDHWNAKLTEGQARYIKSSPSPGWQLADRFGVSVATVWAIRAGRRWKHLDACIRVRQPGPNTRVN